MNKLVYSFWTTPLKERWKEYRQGLDLEDMLRSSLNCLYLSVLYAKKWGFEVEIVTDLESAHLFKELPVDKISDDLTVIDIGRVWTKGKILAISKQTKPFVHIDWDVLLRKKEVANIIKNCTSDVLIQSIDHIEFDQDIRGYNINYYDLNYLKLQIDFEPYVSEEIVRTYDEVCNSAIVGFNNMELKDKYVSNYYKCLQVLKDIHWMDVSRMIDQYSLYCTVRVSGASVTQILPFGDCIQETANQIGYTHFSFLSKYTPAVQQKIAKRIQEEFANYAHLIAPKDPITNKVKISLCTVVMNRFDHIVKTLEHNLKAVRRFKGEIDINVLNYNSTDRLEEYLFDQDWFVSGIKDGLIHYYRNYNAKYYHRTLPKNAIHNLATGEYLINIDADNFVSPSYLMYCLTVAKHERNFFLRPPGTCPGGAIGRILVHRQDFRKLGGYNLKIVNYGFEDTEFTMRLRKLGVKQLCTPSHLCIDIIDHGDALRVANEKPRDKVKLSRVTEDSDYQNKMMEFELYPNMNQVMDIELFHINYKKQKTRIYDTSAYTLDSAI